MASPSFRAHRRWTCATSPRASGWVMFSAIMLAFVGVWGLIEGILAISSSKVFTANATFVFSSLNTWGWIVTVLGALCLLAPSPS